MSGGYIAKNSNLWWQSVSPQKLERPRVQSVLPTGDLAVRHLSPTFPVGDASTHWFHCKLAWVKPICYVTMHDHAINDCGHVDPKPKAILATISLTQIRVHCSSPGQTENIMIWEISSKTECRPFQQMKAVHYRQVGAKNTGVCPYVYITYPSM